MMNQSRDPYAHVSQYSKGPSFFICLKCDGKIIHHESRRTEKKPNDDKGYHLIDIYQCYNCGMKYSLEEMPIDLSDKEFYNLRLTRIEKKLDMLLKKKYSGSINLG